MAEGEYKGERGKARVSNCVQSAAEEVKAHGGS